MGRRTGFGRDMLNNGLLWAALAVEAVLILAIVYTPLGNRLFGTAPLPLSAWLAALPYVLAMGALEELRKWIRGGAKLRSYSQMPIHVRFVLALTFMLVAASTVSIFLIERWNPRTLGELGLGEAWLAAYFQAVSPRTAGFNTIDIGAMATGWLFRMLVLMFIGASPGGTGGGVKTTTFGVTVAALWATVQGQADPSAGDLSPPGFGTFFLILPTKLSLALMKELIVKRFRIMIVDQNKTLPWCQTIEGLKDRRVSLRRRNLPHVYRYCSFFIRY